MSDGNFNRSLLPYHNFQSGVRAGKAQMKKIALDAFELWLDRYMKNLSEEERERICLEYKHELEK